MAKNRFIFDQLRCKKCWEVYFVCGVNRPVSENEFTCKLCRQKEDERRK